MVSYQKMKRLLIKHRVIIISIIITLLVPSWVDLIDIHYLRKMDRRESLERFEIIKSFMNAFTRYTQNAGSSLIEKGGLYGLLFPIETSFTIKVSASANVVLIKNTNCPTNSTMIHNDVRLSR